MNTNDLNEFLKLIEETDILELEWKDNDGRIFFKKSEFLTGTGKVVEQKSEPKKFYIKSPFVGTFLSSPSSDRPPFVVEGSFVEVGQKVAVIETMKILREVTSNITGRIKKILVKDGDKVEYGQNLFLIEPE